VTRSTLIVQPGAGLAPVLRAIEHAKRQIDVAVFRLWADPVQAALEDAITRGVRVRALVQHKARGGERELRDLERRLLEKGVAVSRTADDLVRYHGKYLIVDDTLHLLSFNLVKSNLHRRALGIQTRNRRAVQEARRLFDCDMARQPFEGEPRSPLVVSPSTSRQALERLISGARRQLAIYDARLQDPGFSTLILERAAAGVDVRVIGRAPHLESEVPVRGLRKGKLHLRAIVRDQTHVFVGSQSLRPLELDRRREVGLIVVNPSVARAVLGIFDGDWELAGTSAVEEREEQLDYAPTG
jgi:phosphatidylserine/phosphatidylglycerophosphate/cardiolipin synthase-like enzyme